MTGGYWVGIGIAALLVGGAIARTRPGRLIPRSPTAPVRVSPGALIAIVGAALTVIGLSKLGIDLHK